MASLGFGGFVLQLTAEKRSKIASDKQSRERVSLFFFIVVLLEFVSPA